METWLIILLAVVFLLIAPVLIAYYVFMDARRNGIENPLRWALIAGLVPFYLGLAIYFLSAAKKEMKPR